MTEQDAFERILTALYESMLDDSHWPATSALIDEVCGLTGNNLMVGEGPKQDIRVRFVGLYYRGHRRTDLEREYVEDYHAIDERIPRFRQLPGGRVVHSNDMFTAEELKVSPAYNEALLKGHYQDSLMVRMDLEDGSHMAHPVDGEDDRSHIQAGDGLVGGWAGKTSSVTPPARGRRAGSLPRSQWSSGSCLTSGSSSASGTRWSAREPATRP